MQIINKHSLTVVEVTARERREEFKGEEWIELQSYIAALRAERDELRDACGIIADGRNWLKLNGEIVWNDFMGNEHVTEHARDIARAVLAKYEAQ